MPFFIRTGWVSQYAYINFRVVENFSHGYGLTFNPGERSLPVSQPAWPFLLGIVYSLAGPGLHISSFNLLYIITLVLQITFSILALTILLRLSGGRTFALAVALIFLLLSKAFIEYSTSGLENPLVHLLLASFFVAYKRLEKSDKSRRRMNLTLLYIAGCSVVAVQWQWITLVGPILIAAGRESENRPFVCHRSGLSCRLARSLLPIHLLPLLAALYLSSSLRASAPASERDGSYGKG